MEVEKGFYILNHKSKLFGALMQIFIIILIQTTAEIKFED